MKSKKTDGLTVFLFLLPGLLLFVGILIAPLFVSAYYSFFQWDGLGEKIYVGWGNYKTLSLFKKPDAFAFGVPAMNAAVKHVFILAGLSLVLQLPLSLGLALLLGRGIRGERFFLSVFFLPVLISTTVIGRLWQKIFASEGLVNSILTGLGILKEPLNWLAESEGNLLLIAIFIPMLWQYVGYHMLLMYAGVKSVPKELREAAKIDGATNWQVDRYVVIPSMKQVLKVSVIFAVTGSLKSYDLVAVMAPQGIKTQAAAVPSTVLHDFLSNRMKYGIGSAIAMVLIVLCFFFALLINLLFRDRDAKG